MKPTEEELRQKIYELCIELGCRDGRYSLRELQEGRWVEYLPPKPDTLEEDE